MGTGQVSRGNKKLDGNQGRRHGTWLLAAADTTLEGSGRDLEASGRGFI